MKSGDANQNTEASNCKKIIDSDIPIEELLGSVTAYNNVEGSETRSQQLRTSARVFKKMKLDSAANATPVVPEKKEPVKEEVKPEVRKFRPLWSQEDKDFFFEALNEYGKDFEAIHSHISNKLKKKGLAESAIKSREQIRHFYYRSWHKISKHLKFSDDIKKPAQELYSLINYGELRKKIGFVTEKTTVKLNELIYRGSVAIRHKGKTIRIRTPMCRALRKLNQLDEKHEDLKLPTRVTVELRPKDMQTFMKVQEIAQNPRVKTIVPLQKRLSSIIRYMENRWKTKTAEEYQKASNSLNVITSACLSEERIAQDLSLLIPPLRLTPPPNILINLPSFNLSEYLTSQSICLNAYEERIGVKVPGQELFQIFNTSTSKSNAKKAQKRPRHESTSEKSSTNTKINPTDSADCILDVDEVIDVAVNELLALQNALQSTETTDNDKVNENVEVKVETEAADLKIERIKRGWNLEECANVSIGDLYLMFGSDSTLILEYSWDPPHKLKKEDDVDVEKPSEVVNQEIVDEENEINASLESEKGPSLSLILKRLLSIAKLHYRKNIVKCPCGHVCGSSGNIVSKPKIPAVKFVKDESLDLNKSSNTITTQSDPNSNSANIGTVPILLQTQVNSVSTTPYFRRPNSPNSVLHAQLASIRRLKPKYCNRRGRFRRSQHVVVERKLPVLANIADRDIGGRQIVQMNIISKNNMSSTSLRQIAPKIVDISTNISTTGEVNQTLVNTEYVNGTVSVISLDQVPNTSFSIMPVDQQPDGGVPVSGDTILTSDNATTPSRIGSPTSISNLLELALTPNQNDNKESNNISFAGLLPEATSTPPSSPSRILKENEDNQWLNSEVGDFSLSSFLGHLESPMKINTAPIQTEDSRMGLSQDVDQHLQSLLTENSLDYTAKFADLAARVTDSKK